MTDKLARKQRRYNNGPDGCEPIDDRGGEDCGPIVCGPDPIDYE